MDEFVAKHKVQGWRAGSSRYHANPRNLAIEAVCDLELEIIELLKAEFKLRNTEFDEIYSDTKFFSERGFLNSLGKMSLIAHQLGFLSKIDVFDLQKFYDIRNKFAHVRKRTVYFKDDPAVFDLVKKMHAYQKHEGSFLCIEKDYFEEGVFNSIRDYYIQKIKNVRESLCRAQ